MPDRNGRRLTRYGVDYDEIAETYDLTPVRRRGPDPDLLAFVQERRPTSLAVLDIGCGTGIQLVADAAEVPTARLVGLDPFINMLRVARRKTETVTWIQGDGMQLPFRDGCFDYVTNQFSYHHMDQPDKMFREALRILRPGGRLALTNMTPHAAQDTALYQWFPETLVSDLAAHPAPADLEAFARDAGFIAIKCDIRVVGGQVPLTQVAARYAEKSGCSQLNAMPEDLYQRRYRALSTAATSEPEATAVDQTALIRLVADRRK